MRLNVRCCCRPQKILGSLDVPDVHVARGNFTRVAVDFLERAAPLYEIAEEQPARQWRIEFELAEFFDGGRYEMALKPLREDVSINDLRKCRSFSIEPAVNPPTRNPYRYHTST